MARIIIKNWPKPNLKELIYGVIGLIIGALIVICYLQPKEYVYVDVETIIGEIHRKLKISDISDQDLNHKIQQAKKQFQYEINNYAKQHNAIVMSSPKAIVGAKDITDTIKVKILEVLP